MTIRRQPRPEEEELEVKKAELAVLEEQLALKELDLETLRSEIGTFLRVYLASVGPAALERDRLFARTASARDGALRFSPHFYNTEEELERSVNLL